MDSPLPRRPIRGVIVDVDGTLTTTGRRLNFDAARAVMEVEARGIPVLMATGNVLPISLALHRFLGLKSPIIAENGGLVYFNEKKVVHLGHREPGLRALEVLERHLHVQRLFTDRWRETEVSLEPTVDAEEVRKLVEGMGVRVENTGFAIHLMEPTAGKLPAARVALEPLGLTVEDCLVAGDGENDVELLQAAAVGVSFPEAMAPAKAAAGYVTRSSNGGGLVEALRRFGLVV